jgi:hypothetical protein
VPQSAPQVGGGAVESQPADEGRSRDRTAQWLFAAIASGVAVWGLAHAIGAGYLGASHNPWRGLVVLACVATFLACWGLLVLTQRPRRRSRPSESVPEDADPS